jgi:hypothetical protein
MPRTDQSKDIPEIRLDKTKLKVVSISERSDEIEYWRNASVKERLQHAERLRRIVYGTRATARLQRTIDVVKLERR